MLLQSSLSLTKVLFQYDDLLFLSSLFVCSAHKSFINLSSLSIIYEARAALQKCHIHVIQWFKLLALFPEQLNIVLVKEGKLAPYLIVPQCKQLYLIAIFSPLKGKVNLN